MTAGMPRMTALAAIATLAVIATGCRRIPLCERESDVYLRPVYEMGAMCDTSGLSDEAKSSAGSKITAPRPLTLMACFYDCGSHRIAYSETIPAEGGFVKVPAGTWDILLYGMESEMTVVEKTDMRAAGTAYAPSTGTKVSVGPDSRLGFTIAEEPEHLMVGRLQAVTIAALPERSSARVIELPMGSIAETWTLEIRDIRGAERLSRAAAWIGGLSATRTLWDLRLGDDPVAVQFALTPGGGVAGQASQHATGGGSSEGGDGGDGGPALNSPAKSSTESAALCGVFNTFGMCAGEQIKLGIMVVNSAGGRYAMVCDVTDQVLSPDNDGHRIIISESILVPSGSSEDGGFDPRVSDWDGESFNINL